MPLVALGQTRRSIRTKSSREHVLVVVRVHHTTHPRDKSALPVVVAGEVNLACSLIQCIVLEVVGRNCLCIGTGRLVGGFLGRVHAHHIDVVLLSEGAVEGNQVLDSPVTGLVLRNPTAVGSVGILVVHTCTGKAATL